MSSGENLTINDSPIINSPLTSSPILGVTTGSSVPTTSRTSSGLYHNGVKYEWGKYTPLPDYLCFTANTAGSTIQLTQSGSPRTVSLETSTDRINWTDYTIQNTITLSNIGDKVYFRNKSETTTGFSYQPNQYQTYFYMFVMSGSVDGSGDVTSLINKNCTDTLPEASCFVLLFNGCSSLRTPPKIIATTLTNNCYVQMFQNCSNLEVLPKLPATILKQSCYANMFFNCSKIKISSTQGGEYQTAYIIPIEGTGTTASNALNNMFMGTGGTFTGTPLINTTYYTSNTVV